MKKTITAVHVDIGSLENKTYGTIYIFRRYGNKRSEKVGNYHFRVGDNRYLRALKIQAAFYFKGE